MNIVRPKAIGTWRSCAGVCVLCGIPLGLELPGKSVQENFAGLSLLRGEEEPPAKEDHAFDREGEVKESFLRVGLYKYNLLCSIEMCHVIDRYTFLKDQDTFLKALRDNEKVIKALGGDLVADVVADPGLFAKAADYCQRVAAKVVVPGCKPCNSAMNRSNTHADIVYRCFPPSSQLSFPELEDSLTKEGKVVSKGVTTKKVIQQVALFFRLGEGGRWQAREDSEIMPQACLWRCIASLCMWGKDGGARYRVAASFYASMYIYESLKLMDVMLFLDWHIHVFRVHYMQRYVAGTFFGMLRRTAAVTFDATRKAGSVWCELVEGMLKKAGDEVDLFMRDKVVLAQVFRFKEAFNTHVDSESALFCYLSRQSGVERGVRSIMAFFMYNFKDPNSMLLHTRGREFIKEIAEQVGQAIRTPTKAARPR